MMGNKKLQVWLPLIFSLVLIVGMFFGFKMGNNGSSKGFLKTTKSTSLQEAIDLIRLKQKITHLANHVTIIAL